jgi:hypothetical protein
MKNFFYHFHVWHSRITEFLSSQKHIYTARHAFLHELVSVSIPKSDIFKKMPGILLAVGKFDRFFCVLPKKTQNELANVLIIGKTRIGKGLAIITNELWWPWPLITTTLKKNIGTQSQDFGNGD